MTILYFRVQTSIWIKIVTQLQFRFTGWSPERFRLIFDDVDAGNSLSAHTYTMSVQLAISSHLLTENFRHDIIKNKPKSFGCLADETKLKLGNHFDSNWSLDSKIKRSHSLMLSQKFYPKIVYKRWI